MSETVATATTPTAPADRPWEPFRVFRSPEGQTLGAACIGLVVARRRDLGNKRPALRADQQASVVAVVADLLHRHFTAGRDAWIVVPRGQDYLSRSIRDVPAVNPTLPAMLDHLATLGLMEQVHGSGDRATTLRAGLRLTAIAAEHGVDLGHLRRAVGGGDPIELRAEKPTTKEGKVIADARGRRIRIPDTDHTRRLRDEMTRINDYLGRADIAFDPTNDPLPELGQVDTGDRFLRRVFSKGRPELDRGGRMYGGFWQGMKRERRRAGILINGEATTTLDHSAMGVRLLYAKAGHPLPAEAEPYRVPTHPWWQAAGVKNVLYAAISAEGPVSRFTRSDEPGGVRRFFGPKVKYAEVQEVLQRHHAPIWPLLFRGIVHEMQTWESNYLVDTLLRLQDQDIPALPIHDALIVSKSTEAAVIETMTLAFRDHFEGAACRIVPER